MAGVLYEGRQRERLSDVGGPAADAPPAGLISRQEIQQPAITLGFYQRAHQLSAGVPTLQHAAKHVCPAVGKKGCSTLELTMAHLVDEMNDRAGHAYSGMPARIYIIDPSGRVVYKGGRGPFGFKPREMEQSLVMWLLDQGGNGTMRQAGK